MAQILEVLERIQKELGFKSSKSFHQHLQKRGFKTNYQHFMKLINGEATVLPDFVKVMGLILPKWKDDLSLAYCRDLFPDQVHLFAAAIEPDKEDQIQQASHAKKMAQELSHRQVGVLCQAKELYFLFILATLSRQPLKLEELKQYFSLAALNKNLATLMRENILIQVEGGYQTFSTEIKFPPQDEKLKDFYYKMDSWDEEFGHEMGLDIILQKRFIRRISGRYLKLIVQHFEVIFETVRSADETESRYNSDVIQLTMDLRRGQLPG